MRRIIWYNITYSYVRSDFSFKSKVKFYILCAAVCSYPLLVLLCSSDLTLPWHSLGMFMLEYTISVFLPAQLNWDGRTVEKIILSNGVKKCWGQKIYSHPPHSSSHNQSKDCGPYHLLSHTPFRLLIWKRKEIILTAQYKKKKKKKKVTVTPDSCYFSDPNYRD